MPERPISIAHGGGGTRMRELLAGTIFPLLGEDILLDAEDAAVLELPGDRVAFTTDSFVVKPLFFPGGDIGKLAVCGTVNDLAMRGARPLYLTLGMILEEGLYLSVLEEVVTSVARWAKEAQVRVVAGDTKVVERGMADGMYINTSGIGVIEKGREVSIKGASPGDVLIINGYVGDHGIAVLSEREGFSFEGELLSDCAPLSGLVQNMLDAGEIHSLRDPTRGGIAAAVNEMASASACSFEVVEGDVPVREEVRAVCEMLGMDPLYVANEGKLLAAVPDSDAKEVLGVMREHALGRDAMIIGRAGEERKGQASLITPLGTRLLLRMPSGEQLPRIC
ncbi:MAG: hydrogenase expression/formation protein HypE [Actinobacteria bacterium]|nr:hydrogenase expression/formation protein HypE [Actinomycetota bacterium]